MQHHIPIEEYGAAGQPMADAIGKCVHCGFCLPACPTYELMGEENDSPRGRIFLMKEVLEHKVEIDEAMPFVDRCLGCVGCVTACPSGVQYGELVTAFRSLAETQRKRTRFDRMLRRFVLETLPYPWRFRWATRLGRWAKPLRGLIPGRLRDMLDLLPDRLPPSRSLPELFPAEGRRRGRVALLAGCAQQVLAPDINWATLRVLARNGIEVVVPRSQGCCGALAAHTGAAWQAKALARRNLKAFPADVDAVLTNAAGCGSGMHEYALWLSGEEEHEAAKAFVKRVCDVSVFLDKLGIEPPPPLPDKLRVAYHDACHLAHAQKVKKPPRELLKLIGNLQLLEVPNGEMCCGSAGTYNLEHPDLARQLGEQKAAAILRTQPDAIATGNIGCITQIQTHLRLEGRPIPVLHTIQILDRAYRQLPMDESLNHRAAT